MRGFSLVVMIVAALLVPAPAGASAVAEADFSLCWMAPSPGTGWTAVGYDFDSCAECEAVGAAGVSGGDWTTFLCGFFPIGLDGVYRLYVPSARVAADSHVDAIAPGLRTVGFDSMRAAATV